MSFCFIHPWVSRFRTLGIRRRVWQVENLLQDRAIGTEFGISNRNDSCHMSHVILPFVRLELFGVVYCEPMIFYQILTRASCTHLVLTFSLPLAPLLPDRRCRWYHPRLKIIGFAFFWAILQPSKIKLGLRLTRRISVLNEFIHFLE